MHSGLCTQVSITRRRPLEMGVLGKCGSIQSNCCQVLGTKCLMCTRLSPQPLPGWGLSSCSSLPGARVLIAVLVFLSLVVAGPSTCARDSVRPLLRTPVFVLHPSSSTDHLPPPGPSRHSFVLHLERRAWGWSGPPSRCPTPGLLAAGTQPHLTPCCCLCPMHRKNWGPGQNEIEGMWEHVALLI